MKLTSALLMTLIAPSSAFFNSHDISTHADGSVHMFEQTQHRRLGRGKLGTTAAASFTIHGSQKITGELDVPKLVVGSTPVTETEITLLAGITASKEEINYLDNSALTAADIQKLADITATATQIDYLTASGLTADDLTKLAAVDATATQIDFLTASGLAKTDLDKLAAVDATAAKINYLDNTDLEAADIQKLADITATAAEINLIDGVTGDIDPYRMEKMMLILCNTLGINYNHLVRATSQSETNFSPYLRFEQIELNQADLHGADANTYDKKVDVTAAFTNALCSTKDAAITCVLKSGTGYVIKNALARCAGASCVASDFEITGSCCTKT